MPELYGTDYYTIFGYPPAVFANWLGRPGFYSPSCQDLVWRVCVWDSPRGAGAKNLPTT